MTVCEYILDQFNCCDCPAKKFCIENETVSCQDVIIAWLKEEVTEADKTAIASLINKTEAE